MKITLEFSDDLKVLHRVTHDETNRYRVAKASTLAECIKRLVKPLIQEGGGHD